jgi:hypothetical protein
MLGECKNMMMYGTNGGILHRCFARGADTNISPLMPEKVGPPFAVSDRQYYRIDDTGKIDLEDFPLGSWVDATAPVSGMVAVDRRYW